MQPTIEQRYATEFCVGLGKSGTETLVFLIRSGNKVSKFWMAHCSITSSKKGSNEQIQVNVTRIVFFDAKGVVHNEFVLGTNSLFCFLPRSAKKTVNWVRPAIAGNWKLHHDNAPSHTWSKVNDYLTQNAVETFPNSLIDSTWPHQTVFYSEK